MCLEGCRAAGDVRGINSGVGDETLVSIIDGPQIVVVIVVVAVDGGCAVDIISGICFISRHTL